MKRIVFTGGGTAGHVTPNLALIPLFQQDGWEVHYVGTANGMERSLIESLDGVTYHCIKTGKLRRYFDLKNLSDPFKVLAGIFQSTFLMFRLKPQVLFSKGGFVSVPAVIGAKLAGVPAVIHESDITPGLANKIASKFARSILTTFPEAAKYFPESKAKCVGAVVRPELLSGNAEEGMRLCGFTAQKPVALFMGGSQGAGAINDALRDGLDGITANFNVIHICGKGNYVKELEGHEGYKQFEYVKEELPGLMAMADFAVSRAGSNAIFEFLSARIPMLLIPLPLSQSRGDQLLNAESFLKKGYCRVLQQEEMNGRTILEAMNEVYSNRAAIAEAMQEYDSSKTIATIKEIIEGSAKKN